LFEIFRVHENVFSLVYLKPFYLFFGGYRGLSNLQIICWRSFTLSVLCNRWNCTRFWLTRCGVLPGRLLRRIVCFRSISLNHNASLITKEANGVPNKFLNLIALHKNGYIYFLKSEGKTIERRRNHGKDQVQIAFVTLIFSTVFLLAVCGDTGVAPHLHPSIP